MTLGELVQQMTGHGPARARRRLMAWLKFVTRGERIGRFLGYAALRFLNDDGMRLASGLSYASLLAMVPLLAIALALVSAFPAFSGVQEQIFSIIFEDFLPTTSQEISDRVRGFVENASKMTGPGVIALAATAILLLANINGAFNTIWRVTDARPLATRVLVYWALLTLGPLIFGASLSLSSYAFAAVRLSGLEDLTSGWLELSRAIAVGLAAVGFAFIYVVVPNRRVHVGHALAGGVVAALLFELLKYGFGLYLTHVPSYEAIYGALAVIPIFLIWLFLSWCVVLLGAEVTAALPEWRATRARGHNIHGPGAKLALALSILARLRQAMRDGRQLKREQVVRGLPATPAEVDVVVAPLRRAGFIARSQGGRWLLGRDLTTARLGDLIDAVDLSLEPGTGWQPQAEGAVRTLASAAETDRTRSLESVLAEHESA